MRPAQQAENPRAGRTPARPGRLNVTLAASTANVASWPAPLHAESVNVSREVQLLSKTFVIGSVLLAGAGLLLLIASMVAGITWGRIAGAVLCVPFALVLCVLGLLMTVWGGRI